MDDWASATSSGGAGSWFLRSPSGSGCSSWWGGATTRGAAPRPEPARAVIGATLTLLATAGLASLAGGSPALHDPTAHLSSAGGWVGALVGNPLRAALGGFGAVTVLVALLVVAMVLFTGVSVSSAAGGVRPRRPLGRRGGPGRT